jgi:hypothetical protein
MIGRYPYSDVLLERAVFIFCLEYVDSIFHLHGAISHKNEVLIV